MQLHREHTSMSSFFNLLLYKIPLHNPFALWQKLKFFMSLLLMHLHGTSFGFAIFLYRKASFMAFSTSLYSKGLYFFTFDLNSFLHMVHVHRINKGSTSNLQFLQKVYFF